MSGRREGASGADATDRRFAIASRNVLFLYFSLVVVMVVVVASIPVEVYHATLAVLV